MDITKQALAKGQRALTEYEAKKLLSACGIPVTREVFAAAREEAAEAAADLGYPVVVKGSGPDLMHKSDSGVVFVGLESETAVLSAWDRIEGRLGGMFAGVLVQEMVSGKRELVLGLHREPQFGPCVMLGLGGVLTEIINDTSFRVAPFDESEALDMAAELQGNRIFAPFRGEAAANMAELSRCLQILGRIGMDEPDISEIDINPLIITPRGGVKAVDALIVLENRKP
jgi:succinyl-CoA synthetase beta subunit